MHFSWGWLDFLRISTPFLIYISLLIGLKTLLEKIPVPQNPLFQHYFVIFKSIIHVLIILITIITGLSIFGIDIQGIVTGLGLTSFAIGFILRDIISSALSGAALLLYKPFMVGDEVIINGISGMVSKIDIRYTVIEAEKEKYLIPNAKVMEEVIILKKHSSLTNLSPHP